MLLGLKDINTERTQKLAGELFSINGKAVIITGAGRGIGRDIAISMAERSAFVYCIDISFSEKIPDHLVDYLFEKKCDIVNPDEFKIICDEIFNRHKKIDVLINNAGVTFPKKDNELYPKDHWNKTIDINLTAAFTCSQIVCEYMLKNKNGSIINITSLNAELGFPNNPAYVASKGGLKMLGKAFARDWGMHGIRVNNLGPGYIRTDMTKKSYINEKTRKAREANIMLGRWGEPKDLIGPCIFLASDASGYITGQEIYVDGGWSANGLQRDID